MSPEETMLQSQDTPTLELLLVPSTRLTSRCVLPSPRAVTTGRGAYSWMGQKAGWSVGPIELHAKTS